MSEPRHGDPQPQPSSRLGGSLIGLQTQSNNIPVCCPCRSQSRGCSSDKTVSISPFQHLTITSLTFDVCGERGKASLVIKTWHWPFGYVFVFSFMAPLGWVGGFLPRQDKYECRGWKWVVEPGSGAWTVYTG